MFNGSCPGQWTGLSCVCHSRCSPRFLDGPNHRLHFYLLHLVAMLRIFFFSVWSGITEYSSRIGLLEHDVRSSRSRGPAPRRIVHETDQVICLSYQTGFSSHYCPCRCQSDAGCRQQSPRHHRRRVAAICQVATTGGPCLLVRTRLTYLVIMESSALFKLSRGLAIASCWKDLAMSLGARSMRCQLTGTVKAQVRTAIIKLLTVHESVPRLRFKLHVIGAQGSSTLAPYTCVSRSSHALSLRCPIGCCWALVCTAGLVRGVVVTLAGVSGLAGFG